MEPAMHFRRLLVVAVLGGIASPVLAQNPQCASLPTLQNARQTCDAALDVTRAFHPLAGLLVSGGNAVLGTGSSMGGLGKFAFTLRANAVNVVVPDLNVDANNNVGASRKGLVPAPLLEGAIGIFKGLPGGSLAVDLLGAAQLVPNEKLISDIRVDASAPSIGPISLGIGYGARVGLLGDHGPLPGVSVSVMHRGIPQVGFGDLAAGDDIAGDVNLSATNFRVVVSKHVAVLSLAAGGGWSKYTGHAVASYRDPSSGQPQSIALDLDQSRTLIFADAGLDLKFLKIVGEIGHQSGKDQGLITKFQGFDDTKGTTFYSAGLRFGF
jgi:hypothetical protein